MTIGNGPVGHNGFASLTYSIENVKRDEICQNEDIVAITEGEQLKNVFFSDNGVSMWHSQINDNANVFRIPVFMTPRAFC